MATATYPPDFHPDAIDTRLVLRIYAWITIALGFLVYAGPGAPLFPSVQAHPDLAGIPFGRAGLYRVVAAAVAMSGFTAVGLSRIENPLSRRRALYWFAVAHLSFGAMFFLQWYAIFDPVVPRVVAWTPLTAGVVLMFIALTCAHAPRFSKTFWFFSEPEPDAVLVDRNRRSDAEIALRSQYEEHIRQAARAEERTRLARDLHDAVKQQLFVIQTSAATAQERFGADATGARSAIEQIRASARDALTEMKALIEQLQTAPLENTGLVSALQQQCDALALRTGADVRFVPGTLPPESALLPGTQDALFRAGQEALSNIARHARAKNVTVRLAVAGDRLEFEVKDDGVGFDATAPNAGMGLQNMTARVCEVSGTRLLKTEPGRGTLVAFSVPCNTSSARDYAWRALSWSAVLIVTASSFAFGNHWERPWKGIFALIAAITAARYTAAWHRVREREETPA